MLNNKHVCTKSILCMSVFYMHIIHPDVLFLSPECPLKNDSAEVQLGPCEQQRVKKLRHANLGSGERHKELLQSDED